MHAQPKPSPPVIEAATRVALMDAAEALFGERGFDGASLRDITSRAQANLASVSYHFGSKEGLFLETWARRVQPLNQRRLDRLDALLKAAPEGRPSFESILEAYAHPLFELSADNSPQGRALQRLVIRMAYEDSPNRESLHAFEREMKPVARKFAEALRKADPRLTASEAHWGLYFFAGALMAVFHAGPKFRAVSGGAADTPDAAVAIRRLVAFSAAGIRALHPSQS